MGKLPSAPTLQQHLGVPVRGADWCGKAKRSRLARVQLQGRWLPLGRGQRESNPRQLPSPSEGCVGCTMPPRNPSRKKPRRRTALARATARATSA
eukprot:3925568-Alexandrium_andersonii.AAC.1